MEHCILFGSALALPEVGPDSVHLVVTSPPYWQLKDYGSRRQVGYAQTWQDYIRCLNTVWRECSRVLVPGGRLCINIGDQFARAAVYGRFEVLPIRTEIMAACMGLGFIHMPDIIWRKATTVNTSGGAVVMGSYPFPRNGIPKIDYEFILIFKKPGATPPPSPEARERSRLDAETWTEYFLGHWSFPGEKKSGHLAAFPRELPLRLIRMFTFVGETVLDPFLGRGTTVAAARDEGRRGIGVEINRDFEPLIRDTLGLAGEGDLPFQAAADVVFEVQDSPRFEADARASGPVLPVGLTASRDQEERFFGSRVRAADQGRARWGPARRVRAVEDPITLRLEDGTRVRLLGLAVPGPDMAPDRVEAARAALHDLVQNQRVVVTGEIEEDGIQWASVHLTNRTFVNARLLRQGFGHCDPTRPHRNRTRFENYEEAARIRGLGWWA